MPATVAWDANWDRMLAFRYDTSARFERALRDHIREVDPAVTVDFNYHGNPPFSWEVGQRPVQHAGQGDFVTGETGIWGFSALGVGLNAEFYKSATPGLPVQVAMQRGVRMYHDQTTRPLNDIRWELLTLLAHGTFVTMVDKTGYDGALDPVAYERTGEAFREVLGKREHFGQPVAAEVGLWFSARSRDWYGRETPARAWQGFLGAQRTMAHEHIPYGVILDENVDQATLARYDVVVLPGVAILGPSEVDLLRRYVEEGGRLVVTGPSGTFDARGLPQETSSLEALAGARLAGRLDALDNHVRLPADAPGSLLEGIRPDWTFLVEGPAVIYEPTTAEALGRLHRPHRTVRQRQGREGTEWPMSAGEEVGPAVLVHRLGGGKVVTLAASPDFATAGEHPVVEARRLLRNALKLTGWEPRMRIDAPANVEAVVTREPGGGRLRVHLLGYNAPPSPTPAKNRPYVLPGLIEDSPMYRARIVLRDPPRSVRVLNRGTMLDQRGRSIDLVIDDLHEVVVIDP
jgi:hypothetical protein